jgi:hypothetical protein
MAVLTRVFDVMPTTRAMAVMSGAMPPVVCCAIDTVRASTSVRPSTTADP